MDRLWFVERKLEGETDYVPVGFPEITRKGARKQRDDIKARHPGAPFRVRMYQRVEESK